MNTNTTIGPEPRFAALDLFANPVWRSHEGMRWTSTDGTLVRVIQCVCVDEEKAYAGVVMHNAQVVSTYHTEGYEDLLGDFRIHCQYHVAREVR